MTTNRWSSGVAFYLAIVGASVGLGSIWRFPYLAGANGGGAFVFAFLLVCVSIAVPLLAAEFLIGRHARTSPPRAAGTLARGGNGASGWNLIGILGTIAAFLIMSYYAVIAGWVLAYTWICASGQLTGLDHPHVKQLWTGFLANPWKMGAWHLAFVLIVAGICARGVVRGLEWANKIRAPMLLLLLLILVGYALTQGDVRRGLTFALAPDFRALTPQVWLAAVGQAFYATGVGMGMMLAYGAYLNRGTSLVRSALVVCGGILLVSLLATCLVFPLVFHYRMDPAQGPDLVFDVLATVFAEMPTGRVIGTLFFLLLVFAALTPTLAGMEPVVAWLQQRFAVSRRRATGFAFLSLWLVGLASVLSFNSWAQYRPLHAIAGFENKDIFSCIDYVASDWLTPVGALMTSLFVGWFARRSIVAEQLSEAGTFNRSLCLFLLRFVCPIAIAAVFVSNAYAAP